MEDVEAHRVSTLIPTLDWSGGLVGVRIALEPDDEVELIRSFREAWSASHALTDEWRATQVSGASQAVEKGDESSAAEDLSLWPKDLIDFLARNFQKYMKFRYYVLDPSQFRDPENDVARIQDLSPSVEPLSSNPLEHIVRIDEINAQRGLSDASESTSDGTTRRISDTADL